MRLIVMMTVGLVLAGCDERRPENATATNLPEATAARPARAITASFDCDRARGQAQELVCGDAALAAMDREVARLTSLAMEPAAHAEWVQQRDTCDKADELRQCVMAAAMLKIHRLRQGSESARAGEGISVGPVPYSCRGLSGPLLATFANSELGAVALEWGGQTIAIDQVVAASGAKYEGRWNGEPYGFWSKGKEATLTITGKGDLQCSETPTAS
jgi:membrane-bound inhibitor of C-type lysozyme